MATSVQALAPAGLSQMVDYFAGILAATGPVICNLPRLPHFESGNPKSRKPLSASRDSRAGPVAPAPPSRAPTEELPATPTARSADQSAKRRFTRRVGLPPP